MTNLTDPRGDPDDADLGDARDEMMDDDAESIERVAWLPYRAGYALGRDAVEAERHGHWRDGTRPAAELDAYAQRVGWDRDLEAMELMRQGLQHALERCRPAY